MRVVSCLFTVLFMALLPVSVLAAVVEANSAVTSATVYSDRAMVTRTAHMHVGAGAQVIELRDMPAGMNEATLRVQGKAAAAVKIGTVEVKRTFLTESANTAERDKQAQIDVKQNNKAEIQAELDALKAKQGFITRVAEAGAIQHDANGNAKIDFAPEKWQQAWNLVLTAMGETGKELANKNLAMRKLDDDLVRLQQELTQLHTTQAKEQRHALVSIEAAAETDLELSLTYQTSGAAWGPVYDARLDTNNGHLVLEQFGSVRQITGEDWHDVDLTLSTARPANGSEMPTLREWAVHLPQPMRGYTEDALGAAPAAPSMAMMKMAAPMRAGQDQAEPLQEAQQANVEVTATSYSAEFKVPGRVVLKSANDATKLHIGAIDMKADLMAQATPRLGAQAYLFAKSVNTQSYPLIPGAVAKYRDGVFIGNATLPLLRPGEEAKFAFGSDDRLKLDYSIIKDKQDNPTLIVVGDITMERQDQIRIQNLHKDPIAVMLFDQYPVSSSPDVKVSLMEDVTTAGYATDPDKRPGVIMWNVTLQPRQEKTFGLGFRLKFPKGQNVEGL